MRKQECCSGGRVPCVRGLCVKCFNNARKERNRATPHAAFDYAVEYAHGNLAGAQRLHGVGAREGCRVTSERLERFDAWVRWVLIAVFCDALGLGVAAAVLQ